MPTREPVQVTGTVAGINYTALPNGDLDLGPSGKATPMQLDSMRLDAAPKMLALREQDARGRYVSPLTRAQRDGWSTWDATWLRRNRGSR